jgi:hypothetical protein
VAAQDLGDAHVGDPKAGLESLALDPPVAPTGILARQAEDQVAELRVAKLAGPMRSAAIGSPFAADEVAVPTQKGLRAGQQSRPGGLREKPTEGSKDDAVVWLPAWFPELALQDAELMAEGQHLSSELGVGARANQAQVGEEAGNRVGEAEEHGLDHAGSAELSAEGGWPGYGESGPRCSDRIDSGGFTAHLLGGRSAAAIPPPVFIAG